jgi:heme/copper-type cytochrome/quinol oxidase subunit 2
VKVAGAGIGPARFKLLLTHASQAEGANGLVKTVEEERVVWVFPMWLVYAIAGVVLVVAVYAIWSGGRRSAERKARRQQEEASRIALQDEAGDR